MRLCALLGHVGLSENHKKDVNSFLCFLFLLSYGGRLRGRLRGCLHCCLRLRRGRRRRRRVLDVVDIEVLLEVEIRELVALLEAEESHELGITVDVVLVHEIVLLDVGRDELRHIRAALQVTNRLAEERAQRRRDGRGDLEDADASRLGLLALDRRLAAAALVSHLLNLRRRLLQTLGLADELRQLLTHLHHARRDGLDLRLELLLLDLRNGGARGIRHDRGHHRSRRSRLGLDNLHGLRLGGRHLRHDRRGNRRHRRHRGRGRLLGNRLRGRNRRYNRRRRSSYLLLLRNDTLGDNLRGNGGGDGRAHNTGDGDRRRRHFTQDSSMLAWELLNFSRNHTGRGAMPRQVRSFYFEVRLRYDTILLGIV